MVLSITVGFFLEEKLVRRMGMSHYRCSIHSIFKLLMLFSFQSHWIEKEEAGDRDDSMLSFLGLFLVSKPFHQIISFNPIYSMRSSMPFPIYLRRLRFKRLTWDHTLLGRKQHWGRSWKAFLEITTLFDFLLHVLKFAGSGQQPQEEMILLQRPVSSLCIRRPRMPSVLPAALFAKMAP